MEYVSPNFDLNAFNCPHCHAFAEHDWFVCREDFDTEDDDYFQSLNEMELRLIEHLVERKYQFISSC